MWPIAISYIIRNHFTHEGGVADGTPFFESGLGSDGFLISDTGWRSILEKAGQKGYKVDDSMMRIADIDPSNTRRLDVVLENCHQELDDALGILAKTAGGMALMYATLLTE